MNAVSGRGLTSRTRCWPCLRSTSRRRSPNWLLASNGGNSIDAVGVGFPASFADGVDRGISESAAAQGLPSARTAMESALARAAACPRAAFSMTPTPWPRASRRRAGKLDKLIRVWTLGNGIGFGRYPWSRGRLGGRPHRGDARSERKFLRLRRRGHLEGIMGHRAMRLRFLDMEPEEVFANAQDWRRALRGIRQPSGIARWPPPPPPASIMMARDSSTSPGRMRN